MTPKPDCRFDDCTHPQHGKGMCKSHYMKVWRGQMPDPRFQIAPGPTPSQRFWAKVAKGADDECWIWQASFYGNGYGQFDGMGAHRFAYTEANGPIPDGLVIDHLCQRRQCVRPSHLEAVPQSLNAQRGYTGQVAAARMKATSRARMHCSAGHELTEANTYVTPKEGWRVCRACKSARKRKGNSCPPVSSLTSVSER